MGRIKKSNKKVESRSVVFSRPNNTQAALAILVRLVSENGGTPVATRQASQKIVEEILGLSESLKSLKWMGPVWVIWQRQGLVILSTGSDGRRAVTLSQHLNMY